MPESFASRRLRWLFNLFPAYRGTGASVTYVGNDFREVRIRLPLSWRTRNYVGTIFALEEVEIQTIRELLEDSPSIDRSYCVDLVDSDGVVYASVEKTIYIRSKAARAGEAD